MDIPSHPLKRSLEEEDWNSHDHQDNGMKTAEEAVATSHLARCASESWSGRGGRRRRFRWNGRR